MIPPKPPEDNWKEVLEAAQRYAERGLPVFPVHSIIDGRCTCGKPDCDRAGKHPRTSNGLKAATSDPAKVRQMFERWPDSNIGLITGNGIAALDIDGEQGEESARNLEEDYGPFPETWVSKTGRGYHLFFTTPEAARIGNSAGTIAPGLDIRGEGGYVIVPPSVHMSGVQYEWSRGLDTPPAAAPEWLLRLLTEKRQPDVPPGPRPSSQPGGRFAFVLDGVSEGQRNDTVHRFACSCRARGMSEAEISTLVFEAARNCSPPLPEAEARTIVQQALKHEPGPCHVRWARSEIRTHLDGDKAEFKSCIFEPESLSALAVLQTQDPKLFAEAKAAAKGFSRELAQAVKNQKIAEQRAAAASRPDSVGAALSEIGIPTPEGCEALLIPGAYVIDKTGVWRQIERNDGTPAREDVCPNQLIIARRRFDHGSGEVFLEVTWHTVSGWKSITAPRSKFLTARNITDLSDQGLPAGSKNAGPLADFLFSFDTQNGENIVTERVSSHFGWHGAGPSTFLLPGAAVGPDQISYNPSDSGDRQTVSGFCAAGSEERWKEAAGEAMRFPRVAAMFFAGMSAPLLQILDVLSYLADLSCPTSEGKTRALAFVMSGWGSPAHLIHNWNTTGVGIERLCGLCGSLPVALDDTQTTGRSGRFGFDFAKAIHSIAQGHGKVRGSIRGMAKTLSWQLPVLTTGEARLSDYAKAGGAEARVLSITGSPWGTVNPETARLVERISRTVAENHGHIGPRWVEWIIDHREDWPSWRNRLSELTAMRATEGGVVSRQAGIAAVITLTGQLLHESGLLPWKFVDPMDELWPDIIGEIGGNAVPRRALEAIWAWTVRNETSFRGRTDTPSPYDNEHPPHGGWYGRWDSGDNWKFVAYVPEILTEALERFGYDASAVYAAWQAEGWIQSDGKRIQRAVRFGKHVSKAVVVSRSAFDQKESADNRPEQNPEGVACPIPDCHCMSGFPPSCRITGLSLSIMPRCPLDSLPEEEAASN